LEFASFLLGGLNLLMVLFGILLLVLLPKIASR